MPATPVVIVRVDYNGIDKTPGAGCIDCSHVIAGMANHGKMARSVCAQV